MSDYYVYMVPFPDGIREAVTPGYENDYTIYINENLPDEEKLKAYRHAVNHCIRNDFAKENVQEIEANAHKKEGMT